MPLLLLTQSVIKNRSGVLSLICNIRSAHPYSLSQWAHGIYLSINVKQHNCASLTWLCSPFLHTSTRRIQREIKKMQFFFIKCCDLCYLCFSPSCPGLFTIQWHVMCVLKYVLINKFSLDSTYTLLNTPMTDPWAFLWTALVSTKGGLGRWKDVRVLCRITGMSKLW